MKKQVFIIILLFLQSLSVFIPIPTADGGNWIIDGDKIYVDDENVYLSCEPHTIRQDTDIVFELISKKFGGEIDVVFGIQNTYMKPKNPMIWNGTVWKPLNKQIQVVNYTYQDFTKWYLLKNVNINQNVLYKLKITIDIQFNTSGKYFFGVKRSIDNINQGYYIDPWWDSDWDYCQTLSIDNTFIDTTLRNFPVLVVINSTVASNCMANGEDIRFLHTDNTTEYAYEIEEWNAAANSYVWVNITKVFSATVTKFNIYYGNGSATDNQNPEGVWNDSYVLVWHKNDSTVTRVTDSTVNHASGVKKAGGEPDEATGIVGKCQDYDGGNDYIDASSPGCLDCTDKITIEVFLYTDGLHASYAIIERKDRAFSFYVLSTGQLTFYYWTAGGTRKTRASNFADPITTGVWQYATARYDSVGTVMDFFINTTKDSGAEGDAGEAQNNGNDMEVGGRNGAGNTHNGRIDEFRISNVERNDSWLKASYNTIINSSTFITWGSLDVVADLPDEPSSFTATTLSNTSINLSWTKGTNATHTRIQLREDTYPLTISDGTNVYNTTGDGVNVTSLTAYTTQYFSAWGYNSTTGNWSVNYVTALNNTGPGNPTVVNTSTGVGFLNITWTVGTRSNFSTLVHNATTYPTSPNDPDDNLLYNGTGKTTPSITPNRFYNDSTYASGYYRLYGWANYTDLFSSGVNIEYGSLIIAAYDENTSLALEDWGVFITNQNGSETYVNLTNKNDLVLDIDVLPIGDRTAILVNDTNYNSRLYYMNLAVNNIYVLDAYLPFGNESELYLLSVVDDVDQEVEGAEMRIMSYINATTGYANVSVMFTDANGNVNLYLRNETLYKIIISKEGYQTTISDYIPSRLIFTQEFRLLLGSTEYYNETTINEIITFEGDVDAAGLIYVNYTDILSQTLTTNICIWELNTTTGNRTVVDWDNRSADSSFQYINTVDTTNCYEIGLWMTHTLFGYYNTTFFICGPDRRNVTLSNQTWVEALFEANYGTSPGGFGWTNIIGFLIMCLGMFAFGQRNCGVSLILTGGMLGFVNIVIGWTIIAGFIVVLFILLGILIQWANHRREYG